MKLINKKHVRDFTLQIAASKRKKPNGDAQFTRVSGAFMERINAKLANMIHDEIHRHPSVGTTLK